MNKLTIKTANKFIKKLAEDSDEESPDSYENSEMPYESAEEGRRQNIENLARRYREFADYLNSLGMSNPAEIVGKQTNMGTIVGISEFRTFIKVVVNTGAEYEGIPLYSMDDYKNLSI